MRRIQWRYFAGKSEFFCSFWETGININVDLRAARGRAGVTARRCRRRRRPRWRCWSCNDPRHVAV